MSRPIRIISHSRYVIDRAIPFGWRPGARYTNLRDVKHLPHIYFVDIDWKNYNFERHLDAVRQVHNLAVAPAARRENIAPGHVADGDWEKAPANMQELHRILAEHILLVAR